MGTVGTRGQFTNPEPSPLPRPPSLGGPVPGGENSPCRSVVNQEDKQQSGQAEHSKDVLGHADVSASVSMLVKPHKDVHKASWVPGREGT